MKMDAVSICLLVVLKRLIKHYYDVYLYTVNAL